MAEPQITSTEKREQVSPFLSTMDHQNEQRPRQLEDNSTARDDGLPSPCQFFAGLLKVILPVVFLGVCVLVGFTVGALLANLMGWIIWNLPTPGAPMRAPFWEQQPLEVTVPMHRMDVGARTARPWVIMTRRQAPPAGGYASSPALQTFSVDVPLLGFGGRVVGAGTPAGFEGIETGALRGAAGCQVLLGEHVFASSYGNPFVAPYTPPDCVKDSNTVVVNLTVHSQGRQFDRLAIIYLGDTEVFRTSTEEPRPQGIAYTYMKDMTQYMALWRQPQKLIFDLPNVIDPDAKPPILGTFNTTLTATFFTAPHALVPADAIIPISAGQSSNYSQPSVFTIPNVMNTTASTMVKAFPRNAARAILTVSATGQADEEFWWSNSLQSNVLTYNASANTSLFGYSPFREVQVLIDGRLAGVQWPFPVIFTGGVSPSLWNPMVGIDAFDLKEGEIDISPWLGVLCDGKAHNFSINVVGLDDNGFAATLSSGVASNWQVTGKVFVWLDRDPKSITTGEAPTIDGLEPIIEVSQSVVRNASGVNDTLHYTTSVTRALNISGSITTSSGTKSVGWTQTLTHTGDGRFCNFGSNQFTNLSTHGTDASTYPGASFSTSYDYPLVANQTAALLENGTMRLDTVLSRTKFRTSTFAGGEGPVAPSGLQVFAVLPATAEAVGNITATSFNATQSGEAVLMIAPNRTVTRGGGETAQRLRFGGGGADLVTGEQADLQLYLRDVRVSSSGRVLGDVERLVDMDIVPNRPAATGSQPEVMLAEMGAQPERTVKKPMGLHLQST